MIYYDINTLTNNPHISNHRRRSKINNEHLNTNDAATNHNTHANNHDDKKKCNDMMQEEK